MQEELEKGKFILNIDGVDVVYHTILTFYNNKTKKNYVVYTSSDPDKDDDIDLYASIYDPNATKFELLPVETDEEWNNINGVINNYFKEVSEDE